MKKLILKVEKVHSCKNIFNKKYESKMKLKSLIQFH